jgi:monothiol glutaredoxin
MANTHKISLPIIGSEQASAAAPKTRQEGGDIMSEIAAEVAANKVVLYMKGTLEQPMCGFSQRAAAILGQYNIPVYAVNILADQEKREAIKVFSEWPTIPQVYVDGEFLGGSDILMEMHQNGQLKEVISAAFGAK